MRVVCLLLAITIGIAEAFVPNPFTTTRTLSARLQHRRPSSTSPSEVNQRRVRLALRELSASAAVPTTEGGSRVDESTGTLAVIVCDHGSRRENANEMLFEVAERYRAFAGFDIVEAAHMELAQPSIEQAFDRCVEAGAKKVVLHPFFLSPGRHVTSDIPGLIAAAAKKHPEVAWVVSEPLGLQELMPRVMHAAVSESVDEGAWQYGDGGNC